MIIVHTSTAPSVSLTLIVFLQATELSCVLLLCFVCSLGVKPTLPG